MIEAYPLCWPANWPRTAERERSRFKTTFDSARREVFEELRRMGVKDWNVILSTNLELRRDGIPYATAKPKDSDVGVAIYFRKKDGGQQLVFTCDRWDRIEDNMWAIAKSIDAIRGISRWGASDMMERAFTGFMALPAPEQWWDVLGCGRGVSLECAEAQYKIRIRSAHPDAGGSQEMAAKLNWAISKAREELR